MNYIITESFLDMGNQYRTRVIISDIETIFLSFDHFPTQEEVNVAVELELAERDRPVVIPPIPEIPLFDMWNDFTILYQFSEFTALSWLKHKGSQIIINVRMTQIVVKIKKVIDMANAVWRNSYLII